MLTDATTKTCCLHGIYDYDSMCVVSHFVITHYQFDADFTRFKNSVNGVSSFVRITDIGYTSSVP